MSDKLKKPIHDEKVFYLALEKDESGIPIYDENRLFKFFTSYDYIDPDYQNEDELMGDQEEVNGSEEYSGMVGFWQCSSCKSLHDEIDGDYWCPSCSVQDQSLDVEYFLDTNLPFSSDLDSDLRWREKMFVDAWIGKHDGSFGRGPDFLSFLLRRNATLEDRETAMVLMHYLGSNNGYSFLKKLVSDVDSVIEEKARKRKESVMAKINAMD